MKNGLIKLLYSFFILILYLVSGTLLLLKYLAWQEVPNFGMASLGIVVIGYGLFRGYRSYKAYQTFKQEQDEFE